MQSRKAYLLAGVALALVVVLLLQARRWREPVTAPPDPAVEAVSVMADKARKEIEAYRKAGGKPTDAGHPARKWAAELWKFSEANAGTRAGKHAAGSAFLLLVEGEQWDEWLARAKALPPDDPAWLNSFQLLFWHADFKKDYFDFIPLAFAVRQNAQGEQPESKILRARVGYYLGIAYVRQEKLDQARVELERGIQEAPDSKWAKDARGELHDLAHLNVGQPAPEFTAPTLDGKTITLSGYRGKVVLLDFWATWCGPCLAEFPHLKELHKKFAPRGVAIVGISLDEKEDRAEVGKLIADRQIPWPQVFDGKGRDAAVARLYNVHGVPTQFILDRQGKIAAKQVGGPISKLEVEITRLLK